MPELEVWLCLVHESLDKNGHLEPLDNCVACMRVQRDELLAENERLVKLLQENDDEWEKAMDARICEIENNRGHE